MTKNDLILKTAQLSETTQKQVRDVLTAFMSVITYELLTKGEMKLDKFGLFSVKKRNDRVGRNPKTGEKIHIAAHNSVLFKASQTLKKKLN